jgi:HlyD family secretion protein
MKLFKPHVNETSIMHTRTALQSCLLAFLYLFLSCNGKTEKETPETAFRSAVRRIQHPEEIAALGKILPEEKLLDLVFETSGKVSRIYVQEGNQAGAGEPLILLDAALEENELKALEAQLDGNRLEQEEAREQIAYHEKVLGQQQQTYQRLNRSVEADALPASQLDRTELDLLNSQSQIDAQKRLLDRLAVKERELRIKQEEVQLRRQQKEIHAPGRGTVIRWQVREGSGVQAQEVVGEFAPDGPLLVEAEVDEYFATAVAVGQQAIIRREGFPDTLARGRVIFTAPDLSGKSIFSEDNTEFQDLQVRRIKIRLEDGEQLLLGMKVEAVIQTAQKR